MSAQEERVASVRTGMRIGVFTVVWMVVEATASMGAGVVAMVCRMVTLHLIGGHV